jgi:hypothetical protein
VSSGNAKLPASYAARILLGIKGPLPLFKVAKVTYRHTLSSILSTLGKTAMHLPQQAMPVDRKGNSRRNGFSANAGIVPAACNPIGCVAAQAACAAAVAVGTPLSAIPCGITVAAACAECVAHKETLAEKTWDPFKMYTHMSDRNMKENFLSVDPRQVLSGLMQLRIETWNYKHDSANIRHIGPMAQDFAAAFAVGESDRMIHPIDAQGVTIAAMQGLYQMVCEIRVDLTTTRQRLDDQDTVAVGPGEEDISRQSMN